MESVTWAAHHSSHPRTRPSKGTLEIMAQSSSLHQTNSCGFKESRYVKVAPCVLTRVNASVTFSAVNTATPQLSIEKLSDLAKKLKFITVSEVPDNNADNNRLKVITSLALPRTVFYTAQSCCVHLTQRVLDVSF